MDLVPLLYSASAIAAITTLSVANIDNPSTELNARVGGTTGEECTVYQAVAGANAYTTYRFDSVSSAGVSVPYIIAASGSGQWIAVAGKYVNSAQTVAGALASLSTLTGTQLVSNIATGTAPLVVASTTQVSNLNVSQLIGGTWAIPGTIGSTTANTGKFTTLTASGVLLATDCFATIDNATAQFRSALKLGGAIVGAQAATYGHLYVYNSSVVEIFHVDSFTPLVTVTAPITVSGTAIISGVVTAKATSTVGFILDASGASAERAMTLTNSGPGTKYNFKIGCNAISDNALQIIPSTATGGSTYSTQALSVFGATGNTVLGAGADDATNKLQVGGTIALYAGSATASLLITTSTAGNARYITLTDTGGTKYNWRFGAQVITDNAYEIIPSTATGGSTFSTPAVSVAGATGVVSIRASAVVGAAAVASGSASVYIKQAINAATTSGIRWVHASSDPDYFQAGYDTTSSLGLGTNSLSFYSTQISAVALAIERNGKVGSFSSLVCGTNSALATNATDGFFYAPASAGAPTGTPTAITGKVPMQFDSTNNFLYAYLGGTWKKTTVFT